MALGSVLPFWPALLFGYLEPVSLIAGWQVAFFDPKRFLNSQTPSLTPVLATPDTLTVSYIIGNVYLVLALVAVLNVLITREPRVAKYYLIFIAMGDLGHIYSCYKAMGHGTFMNFGAYNDMMWGNVGASAFLFVNRVLTVFGAFGAGRRGA